ncbi:hypothetical protein ACFL2Q_14655 [Thermodesulfobacteriota bacterium]
MAGIAAQSGFAELLMGQYPVIMVVCEEYMTHNMSEATTKAGNKQWWSHDLNILSIVPNRGSFSGYLYSLLDCCL